MNRYTVTEICKQIRGDWTVADQMRHDVREHGQTRLPGGEKIYD